MKWSLFGRAAMALGAALGLALGMTGCGIGTIAYVWVIGQQYNEISGFKVDNNTGNLTAIPHSPFSANGSMPVSIVVKNGGRYVYVVNQGTGGTPTSNGAGAGIAEYSVGGSGTLTYQNTYYPQGFNHLWAQFDSTGGYLTILDEYSPSGDGNGAITVFSADATTGQLHIVPQTASTPSGGLSLNYLEVGKSPVRSFSTGTCLYTLNGADQSITPYTISAGQLGTVTTGNIFPGTTQATSINGNSGNVFITDAGSDKIFPFTVASGCGLTSYTGGAVANAANATQPAYSFIDAKGAFLFVLNQSSTSTSPNTSYSSITIFTITNGELTLPTNIPNPNKVGAGPVCMVEDPSQQYIYVSNHNDGTITGYRFASTQGTLADLSRGSSFNANIGQPGNLECLALSGNVT